MPKMADINMNIRLHMFFVMYCGEQGCQNINNDNQKCMGWMSQIKNLKYIAGWILAA